MRPTRAILFSMLLFSGCIIGAFGSGRKEAMSEGNDSFLVGEYDRALLAYEKAAVDNPESPYVFFNRGTAYYRMNELESAKDQFQQAALKSKDLILEAMAFYNLGNTVFRQAEKMIQEGLEEAIAHYEEALLHYRRTLEIDPNYSDAAHNMEVTRLVLKNLLDQLSKQQEEQQAHQEAMEDIVKRLQALAEDEAKTLDVNREVSSLENAQEKRDLLVPRILDLKTDQDTIRQGTEEVYRDLEDLAGQHSAVDHVGLSLVEQALASTELGGLDLKSAYPNQERALAELIAALDDLTEENPQSEEEESGEDTEDAPGQDDTAAYTDERAQDIVDEEKEDRDRRAEAQARFQDVDRDW